MSAFEMIIAFVLAGAMIAVGYVLYLAPQPWLLSRASSPVTAVDRWFDCEPRWIWIYCGLYYPFWLSPILVVPSLTDFFYLCVSYPVLLICQMVLAVMFPVQVSASLRLQRQERTLSDALLTKVRQVDKGGNCFPSIHMAITVLTALHLVHFAGADLTPGLYLVWLVPLLIGISALYTRQNLFVDVLTGALLAVLVHGALY